MQIPERLKPHEGSKVLDKPWQTLQTAYTATREKAKLVGKTDREKKLTAIWDEFRTGPLKVYADEVLKVAAFANGWFQKDMQELQDKADGRLNRLGDAFGKLLGSEDAGHDLASLLTRKLGSFMDDRALNSAYASKNRWDLMAGEARQVIEYALSLAAIPKPTVEKTEERKQLLATLATTEENK